MSKKILILLVILLQIGFSTNTSMLRIQFPVDNFSFASDTYVTAVKIKFNTSDANTSLGLVSAFNIKRLSGSRNDKVYARIRIDSETIDDELIRTISTTDTGSTGTKPLTFSVNNGEHILYFDFHDSRGDSVEVSNFDLILGQLISADGDCLHGGKKDLNFNFSDTTYSDLFDFNITKETNSSTFYVSKLTINTTGTSYPYGNFYDKNNSINSPFWFRYLSGGKDKGSVGLSWINNETEKGTTEIGFYGATDTETIGINGTLVYFDLRDNESHLINNFYVSNDSTDKDNDLYLTSGWHLLANKTIEQFNGTGYFLSWSASVKSDSGKQYITFVANSSNGSKEVPAELNENYLRNDSNLAAYWRFENNLTDEVGGNDGTIVTGGVTYSNGKFNYDTDYDGGGYVDVGSELSYINENFSVSIWLKTSSAGTQFIIGDREASGDNKGWELGVTDDHPFIQGDNGTDFGYGSGITNVKDGQWHHIVAVREGSVFKIYVDGIYELSSKTDLAGDISSSKNTFIGRTPNHADNYVGELDDVAIFNRTLTANEVNEIYENTKTEYLEGCNISSTKERYLSGNKDIGNMYGYFVCENLTVGYNYDYQLWLYVDSGEDVYVKDEALSGFEVTAFDISSLNLPPLPNAITNPISGSATYGNQTITWLDFYDPDGDTVYYNVTLYDENGTLIDTIATNITDNFTNYDFTNLSGEYNLTIIGYDNISEGYATAYSIFNVRNDVDLIQNQSCFNETTTLIEYYSLSRYTGERTNISITYLPCQFGCNNGYCVSLTQSINYSFLAIIGLLISIFVFLIFFIWSKTTLLKNISITKVFILSIIALGIGITPFKLTNNNIIKMVGGTQTGVYYIFTVIVTGLLLLTFGYMAINSFRKGIDKEYGLDDEENKIM